MSRRQKGSLLAVSVFHPFGAGHQRARLPMMGGKKKEGFFFFKIFLKCGPLLVFIEFCYNIASMFSVWPRGIWGFSDGTSGKESTCQCRRLGFDPWVGKIPRRRK